MTEIRHFAEPSIMTRHAHGVAILDIGDRRYRAYFDASGRVLEAEVRIQAKWQAYYRPVAGSGPVAQRIQRALDEAMTDRVA